jgi:hypothetical protein
VGRRVATHFLLAYIVGGAAKRVLVAAALRDLHHLIDEVEAVGSAEAGDVVPAGTGGQGPVRAKGEDGPSSGSALE